MQNTLSPALVHRLEDGINHVAVLRADREAVDAFIALLESLILDGLHTAPESAMMLSIDASKSGLPPIRYAYERGLDLSGRVKAPPIRIAFIVRDRLMISLIGNIINVVSAPSNRPVVRFFRDYEREKAAAWLASQEA